MDSHLGSIGLVLWVKDKHWIFAIQIQLVLVGVVSILIPHTSQRMIAEQKHEQDNRQRKAVTEGVGLVLTHYYFWRHVAGLSLNAKVFPIVGHIVVVSNQHISCLWIDEKIAIVQILIA